MLDINPVSWAWVNQVESVCVRVCVCVCMRVCVCVCETEKDGEKSILNGADCLVLSP